MIFIYRTNKYSGKLISSTEGDVFWMPVDELKNKEVLWHINLMLKIFSKNNPSELYLIEMLQH